MTVGTGIGGSASVVPATLTGVGGSASIDDSAIALGIGGDISVDVTQAQAWTRREWARGRVVVEGADLSSIVGTVEWERSAERAAHYATFTVADARVAFAHASSLSAGSLPMRIYRYSASRDGEDEQLVFQGRTEAPSNSEPILPTGTFRCISDAAAFDETRACYRAGAFAGLTRAEILTELAASIGRTIDIPVGWGTTVVRKPVEYVNVSVFEIARRFCEIEGGAPRSTIEGELEIVSDAALWGAPVWAFDETNSFTPEEEPPQQPVTRWVLSGTAIGKDNSGDATTGSGETVTVEVVGGVKDGKPWETRTTTRDSGSGLTYGTYPEDGQVEVVVEEYDTFAPLGTTLGTEAFQLKRRTTTRTFYTRYGTGGIGRTSQKIRETSFVEEWFRESAPKSGYLWTDGKHYSQPAQEFRRTQTTVAEYVWFASDDANRPCELDTLTTTVTGPHAHRDGGKTGTYAAGSPETYTEDTSLAWDDGDSYVYDNRISKTVETFLPRGKRTELTGWYQTRGEYRQVDTINGDNRFGPAEAYGVIGLETKGYVRSAIPGEYVEQTVAMDGSYSSKRVQGDFPEPVRSDGSTPSFAQDTMVLDVTDAASRYPSSVQSETIPEAESLEELEAVMLRRRRLARCVRHTIPYPDDRWLNVCDPVSETDDARSMTEWAGPIEQLRVSVDLLSGFGEAQAVVALEDPNA